MYLSKLTLNPRHVQAQIDLASPYQLHKTLSHAFPDPSPERHRERHGVLFRIEDAGPGGVPVLVQSTSKPDWSFLPGGYVRRVDGPKVFAPLFREGQCLRFRLAANPVRRVRVEGKKHPRRCALVHPRAKEGVEMGYLDWLERQGSETTKERKAAGFDIIAADGVPLVADVPFRLARKRRVTHDPAEIQAIERGEQPSLGKPEIPHFGVRFDGVLRVTDPDRLVEAVRKGIGPAKAFGFGLLSLAPAR